MKLIRQSKSTECGIACAAMLCGKTLLQMRNDIVPNGAGTHRTTSETLRKACAKYKVRVNRRVSTSTWDRLLASGKTALVATGRKLSKSGKEEWHWVVLVGRDASAQRPMPYVLDPRKKSPRFDMASRLKIAWYHSVTDPA